MIKILNLERKQTVPIRELFRLSASARNTYDFIKVNMWNKKFIIVNFHRDQTISVSHNFTDMRVYFATNNFIKRNKINSTENVAEFLFKMIQKYNQ